MQRFIMRWYDGLRRESKIDCFWCFQIEGKAVRKLKKQRTKCFGNSVVYR